MWSTLPTMLRRAPLLLALSIFGCTGPEAPSDAPGLDAALDATRDAPDAT